jgi:hypothetical protein
MVALIDELETKGIIERRRGVRQIAAIAHCS